MKYRGLLLGIASIPILAIPSISIAQEQRCNYAYGEKCYVEDINTIHTKDETVNSRLLDTIRNAINRCLGILATVVLCFCLYAGFKMLTSGPDTKGYDDGLKTLKNALLGLAIILLARMIVSVVFWFVGTLSGGNQTQGAPVE